MRVYTLVGILGLLLALALGSATGRGGGGRAGPSRGSTRVDLVQGLEELVGDLGVLGEQLALDDSLHGELVLQLGSGLGKNVSLAATHAVHARSDGGKTVKAHTNGLTTLLLGENVVLLLLGIGETVLDEVVVAGAAIAIGAGRSGARSGVGSHGDWLRCEVGIIVG